MVRVVSGDFNISSTEVIAGKQSTEVLVALIDDAELALKERDTNHAKVKHEMARIATEERRKSDAAASKIEKERRDSVRPDIIFEKIFEQFDNSFRAYQAALAMMGAECTDDHQSVLHSMNEWLTDDKLRYIYHQTQKNPDLQYTVVVNPVGEFNSNQLVSLARGIGERLKFSTTIATTLFEQYSNGETTDVIQPLGISFALIPNIAMQVKDCSFSTLESIDKTINTHKQFLGLPSPMDALSYVLTLSEQGFQLSGYEAQKISTTSMINKPVHHMVENLDTAYVPQISVMAAGKLMLSDVEVMRPGFVRLCIKDRAT